MQTLKEKEGHTRGTWEDYFMSMAFLVASRATCERKHVGCVLVRDNRVIASGYNGSLPGQPHCDDVGHLWLEGRSGCQRTIHAEANALTQAARHGISTDSCDAYVTCMPCYDCLKLLISAGVKRVFYAEVYRQSYAEELAEAAGVPLVQIKAPLRDSTLLEIPKDPHG